MRPSATIFCLLATLVVSQALTFDSKLSAVYTLSSDQTTIEFTVTLSQEAWVGIGVGSNGKANVNLKVNANVGANANANP